MEKKLSNKKVIFFWSIIFLGLFTLVIVFVEAILRITEKQLLRPTYTMSNNVYVDDKELGYKLQKNIKGQINATEFSFDFYTDKYGCLKSISEKKSKKPFIQKRILVVGDSFTFGRTSFVQSWPYLLEQNLSLNTKVKVFNCGIDGAGAKYQLTRLPYLISSLKPDIVLYAYYIW